MARAATARPAPQEHPLKKHGTRDQRFGTAFVSIHPGLERWLAEELTGLGIAAKSTVGGVTFAATAADLVKVHEHSRLAGRVLVRVGRVNAASLEQLAQSARLLPWKRFVHPRQAIEVEVTTHNSRLRRKEAVARKLTLAIGDALRGPRLSGSRPPREPARVFVRIEADKAQLSMDASGDRLHRRGYRQQTAKAPLRENLAAAVLAIAEWKPGEVLVDPMCGSGTFGIEAAAMSLGMPVGAGRHFAFERWPDAPKRKPSHPKASKRALIWLSDREEGAIRATRANAKRARVGAHLQAEVIPFEELEPPAGTGLLVANPPWGLRIGQRNHLASVYRSWGERMKSHWSGWRVAMVLPDPRSLTQLGLGLTISARFSHGGQSIVVATGKVTD